MINIKYFIDDIEIIIFDRGKTEDGTPIFRFYFLEDIPDECPWKIIEDAGYEILASIAMRMGEPVRKQYYVTPPDEIEWWMGSYTYLPNGQCIHCDPIAYGDEDGNKDISEVTANFVTNHLDELLKNTILDKPDTEIIQ